MGWTEAELVAEATAVVKGTSASYVRASVVLARAYLAVLEQRDLEIARRLATVAAARRTDPVFQGEER
jgi:hypothetical protein